MPPCYSPQHPDAMAIMSGTGTSNSFVSRPTGTIKLAEALVSPHRARINTRFGSAFSGFLSFRTMLALRGSQSISFDPFADPFLATPTGRPTASELPSAEKS